MNTKAEHAKALQGPDIAKLVLAGVVLIAGFVGYYWVSQQSQSLLFGWLAVLAGIAGALAIANFTSLGARARNFFIETRFEMRKVVWPTRDETIKTTLLVLAVTVLIAMLLGAMDLILKSVVLDWLLSPQ